jgi:primosomal protein N' (replication factor Y)
LAARLQAGRRLRAWGKQVTAPDRRVQVLLPLPLPSQSGRGTYDYLVPEYIDVKPGDFVEVPLGNRLTLGVVWSEQPGEVAATKLKPIHARLPATPMRPIMRRFIDWVADYTLSPPGAVLRMAMNVTEALYPPRPTTLFARAQVEPPQGFKMTAARKLLLDFLADAPPMPLKDLARQAGVGTAVIKALATAGLIETHMVTVDPPVSQPDPERDGFALSPAQQEAADRLRQAVADKAFGVSVVDGVPGAGKTEVYFEAIAACLGGGKQALVMLPEIALGAQWLQRFERRFGVLPTTWNSDLTSLERRRNWRAVADGRAKVVVGARSALFLPFAELGLIIVDEEHDGAFKQEDGVIYNARDMAVVRARLENVPIVLVSATPSLETAVNVEAGRYEGLHLPARHSGAALPQIAAIDLRRQPPERQRWLSPPLIKAIGETLATGRQALLFLNRRGYAPLTLCRSCGHRMECPNCSAWLVEHRFRGRLTCHHCGHSIARPQQCPSCQAEDSLVACGPGVERLAEEVRNLFPEARLSVLASDMIASARQAQALIQQVADHEVDLVIGTQIVAKGHHFPDLSLVGVIDADLGLTGGDLRAAERTYQLLYQVAGRAGREAGDGKVLLQTYQPLHPVIAALASFDRARFLAAEKAERAAAHMPPFGRLAGIIVSGADDALVDTVARDLGQRAPKLDGVQVLGPAPAPLALLRGRHRRRLLLKARRDVDVQTVLRNWLGGLKVPASVRVQVDIDPYSFM